MKLLMIAIVWVYISIIPFAIVLAPLGWEKFQIGQMWGFLWSVPAMFLYFGCVCRYLNRVHEEFLLSEFDVMENSNGKDTVKQPLRIVKSSEEK